MEDISGEQTPEPKPKKIKITAKKEPQIQKDDVIKETPQVMKQTEYDYDRFGEYVAMELRNLKSDYFRGQLRSIIRKAIAEYADLDERTYWSSVPSSSNSSAVPSTSTSSKPKPC